MNISPHRALGTSPHIQLKMKSPLLSIDERNELMPRVHKEYKVRQERERREEGYKKEIVKGKKEVNCNLEPGNRVLVYDCTRQGKWKPKWLDGFVVERKIEPDAYMVRKGNKTRRVNKAHVKRGFQE